MKRLQQTVEQPATDKIKGWGRLNYRIKPHRFTEKKGQCLKKQKSNRLKYEFGLLKQEADI